MQSGARSILLTGAGSYLGQQTIGDLLRATGWSVTAVGSPRLDLSECIAANERLRYLSEDLSDPSASFRSELAAADVVLHLAWVRHPAVKSAVETNMTIVDGLLNALPSRARLVFMSSVAASPHAQSSYGQAKFALSEHVAAAGGIVLTCGLVCADRPQGPYKQLIGAVDKLPLRIVPIGHPPNVYPVALADVLAGLRAVAEKAPSSGVYRLWQDVVPMDHFLESLPVRPRAFRLPMPVPFTLINPVVKLLRTIHVLPASIADQLKTFLFKDDEYLGSLSSLPEFEFSAEQLRN